MQEKIKVNLSYNVFNLLQKDMEDFKYQIKDGSPNKNAFYNTIVKNMVEIHKKESEIVRRHAAFLPSTFALWNNAKLSISVQTHLCFS